MKAKKDMLKIKRRMMIDRKWSTVKQHVDYVKARLNRLGEEPMSQPFLAFLLEIDTEKAHKLLNTRINNAIEDEL